MSKSDSIMSRRNFVKMGAATIAGLAIAPNNLNGAGTEVYNEGANDLYPNNVPNSSHKLDFDGFRDNNHNLVDYPNKLYNPAEYSGLGRVVLGKNMVNGVNTLTQAMINTANTIYIIQYDYILDGNIILPANCILQFEGGSIKNISGNNYKVTGTRTLINTDVAYNIFNDTLGGGFELPFLDLRWVGGVSDWNGAIGTDNSTAFERAINYIGKYYDGAYIKIVGQYYIGTGITTTYNVNICGFHNNSRHLLPRTEIASVVSPSLIVVGANIAAFTMNGRSASGSTTSYANFSLKNLKIQGVGINQDCRFMNYYASGSPSRVSVIEECEIANLTTFLYGYSKADTLIGDLTISKCNVYNNNQFLRIESDSNARRTLCNCIIKDSNIEQNGREAIEIQKAFGSIIIDNNILEGQDSPIHITLTYGQLTISNNYFEANTGKAIWVSSSDLQSKVFLEKNHCNEKIRYDLDSCEVYGSLDRASDDTIIKKCLVEDYESFKLKWIPTSSNGCYVTFPVIKIGSDGRNMLATKRYCNLIGVTAPKGYKSIGLSTKVSDATKPLYCAFYTNGAGNIGYYKNGDGNASYYSNHWRSKCAVLVVYKALPKGTGENVVLMDAASSEQFLSMQRFIDEDTNLNTLVVPDTNTALCGTTRPSFSPIPTGYTFFDKKAGKPIFWNGNNWVDSTGASV